MGTTVLCSLVAPMEENRLTAVEDIIQAHQFLSLFEAADVTLAGHLLGTVVKEASIQMGISSVKGKRHGYKRPDRVYSLFMK